MYTVNQLPAVSNSYVVLVVMVIALTIATGPITTTRLFCDAFVVKIPITSSTSTSTSTASSIIVLNLLPTQGNQLVAASSCAYDVQEEEGDKIDYVSQSTVSAATASTAITTMMKKKKTMTMSAVATDVARSLVSRVFHLSNNNHHDNDRSNDEWLHYDFNNQYHNKMMIDSMTSSQTVVVEHSATTASATTHTVMKDDIQLFPIVGFVYVQDAPHHSRPLPTISQVSCPLHYQDKDHREELYGWFSHVCRLASDE
jgi:type IV secretory pathway VirB9-like protein